MLLGLIFVRKKEGSTFPGLFRAPKPPHRRGIAMVKIKRCCTPCSQGGRHSLTCRGVPVSSRRYCVVSSRTVMLNRDDSFFSLLGTVRHTPTTTTIRYDIEGAELFVSHVHVKVCPSMIQVQQCTAVMMRGGERWCVNANPGHPAGRCRPRQGHGILKTLHPCLLLPSRAVRTQPATPGQDATNTETTKGVQEALAGADATTDRTRRRRRE